MFSRFDNMMQHTQTHNKNRTGRRGKQLGSKKASQRSKDYAGMPSPPPSRRNSIQNDRGKHRSSSSDEDYDEYEEDSDASYHPPENRRRASIKEQRAMMAQLRRLSQDEAYQHQQQQQQQQMQQPPPPSHSYYYAPMPYMNMPPHPHWQLPPNLPPFAPPPHHYPESPPSASSSSSSVEDYSEHQTMSPRRVWRGNHDRTTPKVHFHPYPHRRRYNSMEMPTERVNGLPRRHSDNFMNGRMILPRLATFLVNNPDQPPENYLTHISESSMGSSMSEDHHHHHHQQQHTPPPPLPHAAPTRRLSVQDLCNPIESLHEQEHKLQQLEQQTITHEHQQKQQQQQQDHDHHEMMHDSNNNESISLTEAEYEALQGFGRFRLVMSSSTPSIKTEDEGL